MDDKKEAALLAKLKKVLDECHAADIHFSDANRVLRTSYNRTYTRRSKEELAESNARAVETAKRAAAIVRARLFEEFKKEQGNG